MGIVAFSCVRSVEEDGNCGPIGFLKEAFVKSVRKKDANVPGNRSLFFVNIGELAHLTLGSKMAALNPEGAQRNKQNVGRLRRH